MQRDTVSVALVGPVTVVTIDRPERRNAVDPATASRLRDEFDAFDSDPDARVAVLTGGGGTFCSGADLAAVARGDVPTLSDDGPGPMGPTRSTMTKPVIGAIEGFAVAGGLELALWCDLRVAATDSVFGVYCRRVGMPLVDLGTIRLPRLIGHSRAMDLLLTGRTVQGPEAFEIGLVNRLVGHGHALDAAIALGAELASLPQACLRSDRLSMIEQWSLDERSAIANEARRGRAVLEAPDALEGTRRFAEGTGRGGASMVPEPGAAP